MSKSAKITSLVNYINSNFSKKERNEHHIVELIDSSTYQLIENIANQYTLQSWEYSRLTGLYGEYNSAVSNLECKVSIVLDVIQSLVNGEITTFTSLKKSRLAQASY